MRNLWVAHRHEEPVLHTSTYIGIYLEVWTGKSSTPLG